LILHFIILASIKSDKLDISMMHHGFKAIRSDDDIQCFPNSLI